MTTTTSALAEPISALILELVGAGLGFALARSSGRELRRFALTMLRIRVEVDRRRLLAAREHVRNEIVRFVVGAGVLARVLADALFLNDSADHGWWSTVDLLLLLLVWAERADHQDRDELRAIGRSRRIPPESR